MIRRTLTGLVVSAIAATTLVLVAAPADAAVFTPFVTITCTSTTFTGQLVLNRDNTGGQGESLTLRITDGLNRVLVNRQIKNPLGSYNGLGTFKYNSPITNPIIVSVVSDAGNGLPQQPLVLTSANCTLPQTAFVRLAFHDFLGREPTSAELESEVYALQTKSETRADVANRLSQSREYLSRLIDQLYVNTLGRRGDFGGVNYWVDQIRSGRKSLTSVTASFYASDEYFRGIGGGSYETWVRDLYVKLLARSPEDGGVDFWVAQARRSRTPVALNFFQTPESRRTRIFKLFNEFLGRNPSDLSLSYWYPRILANGDLPLAAALASTAEYNTRAQSIYRF